MEVQHESLTLKMRGPSGGTPLPYLEVTRRRLFLLRAQEANDVDRKCGIELISR